MAKKKTTKAAPAPAPIVTRGPVTKRDGTSDASAGTEPEVQTETGDEVENAVEPATVTAPDHTAIHGAESIVGEPGGREYYLWVGGRRYVHVGEHGDRWVYRPD